MGDVGAGLFGGLLGFGLTRRETLNAVREFERIAAGVGVNFGLTGLLVTVVGWLTDD